MQLSMIGLFSKNRYEWVIAEQACNSQGIVTVPLYDTLGADAVSYILGQTGMTTVFVEKAALKTVRCPCSHVCCV